MSQSSEHMARLTHEQFFRTAEMLKLSEEWLKTHSPTYVKAAEHLSSKLGFTVTPKHVAEAQRLTGVTWALPASGGVPQGLKARVADLEKRLDKTAAENAVLRGLVHELYWQLGAKFPPEYAAPPDPKKKPAPAVGGRG